MTWSKKDHDAHVEMVDRARRNTPWRRRAKNSNFKMAPYRKAPNLRAKLRAAAPDLIVLIDPLAYVEPNNILR
jgi:hypothetical protein